MLDIYQSSVIITAFFFTGLGGFAIWKNPKDVQVRLFSLLSFSFALWSYSWFGLLKTSSDINLALFYSRVLNLGATLIPVFYLHWVLLILGIQKKRKTLIIVGYAITIAFVMFSFSNIYIPNVASVSIFPYWPVAGPLYSIFIVVCYIGFVMIAMTHLLRGYIISTGDKRHRIIFVILGTILGFGGGAINFPMMYGIVVNQPFDLIGIFMVMASPLVLSYAAVHYRLFDFKKVVMQLFAGALNVVFIINILLAQSFGSIFINSILLIFTIWFTILLLNTLKREVSQRERIEKLAGELQAANVGQQEFMHFLSHEVKGYFTVVSALYDTILTDGDYGPISDKLRRAVTDGLSRNRANVNDIENILISSDVKNGAVKYDMKPLDFRAAIATLADEEKVKAVAKGLKFTLAVEDGKNYLVNADDRQLMTHAIRNLFENAIIYTLKGEIMINLSRHDGKILLAVTDSGVGITDEDKVRLFTEGGRGKESSKVNAHSTGHGLYIAKRIVEAHGGKVWAESAGAGKGSIFFVELPPLAPIVANSPTPKNP